MFPRGIYKLFCSFFMSYNLSYNQNLLYNLSCNQNLLYNLLCNQHLFYNLLYSMCYNGLDLFCDRCCMTENVTLLRLTCYVKYLITDWIMTYITCYRTCHIGINRISMKNLDSSWRTHNSNTPYHLIDQFKNKYVKVTNKYSFWAANYRWNAMHIQLCMWCSLFPPFLFSPMKPLIGTVVLYLEVYHCQY